MAIIKLGATVVGIRGTVGGIVFSQSQAGPTARAWSRGANPRTTVQQTGRARMSEFGSAWRALSAAQRSGWDTYAAAAAQDRTNRFGETFSATGFNWFVIINRARLDGGLAIRDDAPTDATPSAPTIDDFQVPLTDNQTAYIEYPSGSFAAGEAAVLDVSIYIRESLASAPRRFRQMFVIVDPPDEWTGFAVPFQRAFGLGLATYKAFCRFYRQSPQGRRSAPATATFEAGDSPGFTAGAKAYDGSTTYANRGGALTGAADTKTLTLVASVKRASGGAAPKRLLQNTASRVVLAMASDGTLNLICRSATPTKVVDLSFAGPIPADDSWHSFGISVDVENGLYSAFYDGVPVAVTLNDPLVDETIDITVADTYFAATTTPDQIWDGCISSFYLDNSAYQNFTDPNAIAPYFGPDGSPRDLGADGSYPTNSVPLLYFPDGDASANSGSGGNFTNNTALSNCADAP